MIRIWFFWTPALSRCVLASCVDHPDFEVAYVVTQPDKPVGRHAEMTKSQVRTFAEERWIPVFTPQKVRGNTELFDELSKFDVDYLVVVAYGKILPKEILELPKKLPINVHGSILPKYRWASPIQAVLLAWEKKTGITIMVMSEGMDEGDMLRVAEIDIAPKETAETLFAKFEAVSWPVLVETILDYENGLIVPRPQDHDLATKCSMIRKEDGRIDFHDSAETTFRKWQAYTPWPGIWCEYDGKRCKILDCEPVDSGHALEAWKCELTEQWVLLGFTEGKLRIITIQIEGKTATPAMDFVRSKGWKVQFS